MIKVICLSASLFFTIVATAQFSTIYSFDESKGKAPNGSLTFDGTYFYGLTSQGGDNGVGTIFKMLPDGMGFEKLYDFDGDNAGSSPVGSLYFDGSYLYGVTQEGGAEDAGTIFKILPDGSGFDKLFDFTGLTNGWEPKFVTLVSDGTYLYGTTSYGGPNDMGVVFRIKLDGSGYSNLLEFTNDLNGRNPYGSLLLDDGMLYGMTEGGGNENLGTIFKVSTDGSGYTKLFDFTGTETGNTPYGTIVTDGTYLYGLTNLGGLNNAGVVFKVLPDGSGFTKLADMDEPVTGSRPYGSLYLVGTELYGLTSNGGINSEGTLFKLGTNGSGFSVLFNFGADNGSSPFGSLNSDGTDLYGMTAFGGDLGAGTIFKFQDVVTNIAEQLVSDSYHFYPNPSSGLITVEWLDLVSGSIALYNAQGILQVIINKGVQELKMELHLELLPRGMYTVVVSTNEYSESVKIMLQ